MKNLCVLGIGIFINVSVFCFGSPATLALDQYLQEQKAVVTEGHISVDDCGKEEFFTDLLHRESWVKTISEIGFNAGHSSVTFLDGNPTCTVVSFDIMVHPYAKIGKRFVDASYPNRHTLVEGDSLKSVPAFYQAHPSMRFDLIFIDGGHDFSTAYGDLVNMRRLATSETLVVVDDINYLSVAAAWDRCVARGIVREVQRASKGNRVWVVGRYAR